MTALAEPRGFDFDGLARILSAAGAARCRSLTVEESFIFLTIGYLSLSEWGAGYVVRHVPCADVGAVLNIPKETVRRKANLLSERGLVSKNSHGVAVAKIGEWVELAAAMLPKNREPVKN
jgi:hypothetical protein